MKTNFDIDAYLRAAEGNFSNFDDEGCYGWVEEPVFNRKRILLLCR
jgi:hypothetical protein